MSSATTLVTWVCPAKFILAGHPYGRPAKIVIKRLCPHVQLDIFNTNTANLDHKHLQGALQRSPTS